MRPGSLGSNINSMKKWKYEVSFFLYVVFLCWAVLFKCSIPSITNMIHYRVVNWRLFYPASEYHSPIVIFEQFCNFMVFIPFGFYLEYRNRKFGKNALYAFLLSFLFETLQYVFAIGISDATDVLMNTLGAVAGQVIMTFLLKVSEEKAEYALNLCFILTLVVCACVIVFGIFSYYRSEIIFMNIGGFYS